MILNKIQNVQICNEDEYNCCLSSIKAEELFLFRIFLPSRLQFASGNKLYLKRGPACDILRHLQPNFKKGLVRHCVAFFDPFSKNPVF